MVFRSPYSFDPPRTYSLPAFFFQPVSVSTAAVSSTEIGQRSRLRQPLLYPTPSPTTSRLDAEPLNLVQLCDLAYDFAVGLQVTAAARGEKKWGKGDVLALYATNQLDYLAVVLSILLTGASAALCNPLCKPNELAHQMRMVGARTMVTTASSYSDAAAAADLATQEGTQDFKGLARAPEVLVFESFHTLLPRIRRDSSRRATWSRLTAGAM
ncbi:hypothetical protein ACQY0O_000249 [Thecaphora frezii]